MVSTCLQAVQEARGQTIQNGKYPDGGGDDPGRLQPPLNCTPRYAANALYDDQFKTQIEIPLPRRQERTGLTNQNVQVPGEIDIVVCKQTSTPNNGLLTGYPNLRSELRNPTKQSRKVGEELSMNSRIAKLHRRKDCHGLSLMPPL